MRRAILDESVVAVIAAPADISGLNRHVFEDRHTPGDWHVQLTDDDGGFEMAIFSGPWSRERTIMFAERCHGSYEEVRTGGGVQLKDLAQRGLYKGD